MEKDKNCIEFVVLKYFIRVIKDDGKYVYFMSGINNNGIIKYMLKNKSRYFIDSPFINASTTDEVIKILKDITKETTIHERKKKFDKYDHVTIAINHLLHFFMESNGVPIDKLCSLGEEIYSLSCNKLFGDTIEDIKKHDEKNEEITNIDKIKAKIFHDDNFKNKNIVSKGHALGRMPDDDYVIDDLFF